MSPQAKRYGASWTDLRHYGPDSPAVVWTHRAEPSAAKFGRGGRRQRQRRLRWQRRGVYCQCSRCCTLWAF